MLRSRSQWAQADAAGCLGWVIGSIHGTALHEILPLATQLMVKHTTTDDEVFIREERQREKRGAWGPNRSSKASDNRGGGSGDASRRSGGSKGRNQDQADQDQARERMDNIRVYTLIFLLKVRLVLNWALLEELHACIGWQRQEVRVIGARPTR